jgi:hypothetical protein
LRKYFFSWIFFCLTSCFAALFFLSFFFHETQPRLRCSLVGGLLGVVGGWCVGVGGRVTIWGGGGGSGSVLFACAVSLFRFFSVPGVSKNVYTHICMCSYKGVSVSGLFRYYPIKHSSIYTMYIMNITFIYIYIMYTYIYLYIIHTHTHTCVCVCV